MSRHSFVAAGVLMTLAGMNVKAAEHPNVIVVLSDDQGYGDLSRNGNPLLKTPNLDRLAEQSIRLTDFHVSPMCTPTRGQLLTGVDALRNKATSVSAGRSFLRPDIYTMPQIFALNGYRTGMFGKWHLGDSYPNLPSSKGFQESVHILGWGVTALAETWLNDCFNPRAYHNGVLKKYDGYCTDVWFNEAMAWMKGCQKEGKPFFAYIPTNAPHGPHWVDAKYLEPYRKGPAAFFGMIANLDENVGRLDAMLKETGLAENTILIYMTDNGGTAGVKLFNAGMRGKKTEYYDGGHRTMCFIRWPAGKLRASCDIDALTQVQDILPTLVDLCDIKTPKAAEFDGVDLATLLRGTHELADRKVVVQYGQIPEKWTSAVLWNKWRLVKGTELYNIASDPAQENDIAAQHPDIVAAMRAHYEKWWSQVEPNLHDFVPVVLGADEENPVCLTAADWSDVYCDNMQQLRSGAKLNGPWHVIAQKSGEYEIALRRWPKEADAAIGAGVPEFKAVVGALPAGVALPVAKARLKIAGLDETKSVGPTDKEVRFSVRLEAGAKLPMQSWFYNAEDQELSGAYFAYVRRLTP